MSRSLKDIIALMGIEGKEYIESLIKNEQNKIIELIEAGIIDDGNGGNYDLYYDYKKMQREDDETLIRQIKQSLDNYKLGWVKCNVGNIVSANHMSNKYWDDYKKRYISNNTPEYLEMCKTVHESLSKTNLQSFINKDNTDILSIDLKVFVYNVRKDTDNCEKAIIDSISRHLGINDNIIKVKKTICLPRRAKDNDYFMFKFQKITQEELKLHEINALSL